MDACTPLLSVIIAIAAATSADATADSVARGIVYDDQNRNGQCDAGEPGIPDVRVSNGRDIVRTRADGKWELPVTDDTILFLIKPRDWMTPVDALRCPQFHYIHKPAGSPALKYPGVPPTGPLPEQIAFALHRRPEPERFEVLLFGDSQPYSLDEVEYLAHDVIEPLVGAPYAFGMSLGDLVGDDLDLHEPLKQAMAHVGLPWYYVLGNHDMDFEAAKDQHSDDAFERAFGPPYYSFDYGPVHFIVLDDVIWVGATDDQKGRYHGGLGAAQMEFLKNDLALVPQDQLVVLTMHIPIIEIAEKEALFELLAERPHTVSFSAHYHFHHHWFLDEDDGWPGDDPHHHVTLTTTSGSWWRGAPDEVGIPHTMMRDGAPNGWCIATFDGNQYKMRYQAARRPADYQMNIWAPNAVAAADTPTTEILVNVFAGSERSTVKMRVGHGAWQTLGRLEQEDPYYAALKAAEESDHPPRGRNLPRIIKSPHLWRGTLAAALEPGTHRIEVKTMDMFGQTYTAYRLIRVE